MSEAPAWDALERLSKVPARFAHYALRHACGLPPCPAGERVKAWLARHADVVGPLLEPDARQTPILYSDSATNKDCLGLLDLGGTTDLSAGGFSATPSATGILTLA